MKTTIINRQYSWHTNNSHSNCVTNCTPLALPESQVHWFSIWALPTEEPWIIKITLLCGHCKVWNQNIVTFIIEIHIPSVHIYHRIESSNNYYILPVLPWEHCSSGWSNLKRQPGSVPSRVQFWNGVGIMAVTSSPSLTSAYISGCRYKWENN